MPDPLSDVLRLRWDEARAPQRALAVTVNQSTKQAQVIMLANSIPIPQATITYTVEELHAHIIGCIRAYDMLRNPTGQKKLVLPFMMGGKPIIPT
jgi:hypothetical protein